MPQPSRLGFRSTLLGALALTGCLVVSAFGFVTPVAAGGVFLLTFLVRRSRRGATLADRLVLAAATLSAETGPAAPGVSMPYMTAPSSADGEASVTAPQDLRRFGRPAGKGVQRARVGYRRVRISSRPDAVRSEELGRLERGHEVEILGSFEGFLQVRTPDDVVGWILRHTIVGAPT